MGKRAGSGSGSSRFALGDLSSSRAMHRLKSGKGDAVRDFMRMLITTSGL